MCMPFSRRDKKINTTMPLKRKAQPAPTKKTGLRIRIPSQKVLEAANATKKTKQTRTTKKKVTFAPETKTATPRAPGKPAATPRAPPPPQRPSFRVDQKITVNEEEMQRDSGMSGGFNYAGFVKSAGEIVLESFNLESPASGLSMITATVVCKAKRARDPPERVSVNMFSQTQNMTAQTGKTWRSVKDIVWGAMDNKRLVLSVEVELKYVVVDSKEEEELQEKNEELEDNNFPVFAVSQGPVTKKRKVS